MTIDRMFERELDMMKDCVDKALYQIKRFYDPVQYELEVDFSRRYFVDFCNRNDTKIYRDDLIAYFDRRVLEILTEEKP